jgi:hypothetical protein
MVTLFYASNQKGQHGKAAQRFASTEKGSDDTLCRESYVQYGTLKVYYSSIFIILCKVL